MGFIWIENLKILITNVSFSYSLFDSSVHIKIWIQLISLFIFLNRQDLLKHLVFVKKQAPLEYSMVHGYVKSARETIISYGLCSWITQYKNL